MFPGFFPTNRAKSRPTAVYGGMFVFNQKHVTLEPNIPMKIPFDAPQPLSQTRFLSPDLTVLRGGMYLISLNLHILGGVLLQAAENLADDAAINMVPQATFVRAQVTADDAPAPQLSVELNTRQSVLQLLRQAEMAQQRIYIPPEEFFSVSQSGLLCLRAGQRLAATILTDGISILDIKSGSDLTAIRIADNCPGAERNC